MIGLIGIGINFVTLIVAVSAGLPSANIFWNVVSVVGAIAGGSCVYSQLEDTYSCLYRILLYINIALSGFLMIGLPISCLMS
jgi:hypothetical protein